MIIFEVMTDIHTHSNSVYRKSNFNAEGSHWKPHMEKKCSKPSWQTLTPPPPPSPPTPVERRFLFATSFDYHCTLKTRQWKVLIYMENMGKCPLAENILKQGGRGWQPFGESKNGHKTFVRRVFAIFATKARNCKDANLIRYNIQYNRKPFFA